MAVTSPAMTKRSTFTLLGFQRHEFQREARAVGLAVFDRDARGVQLGDALHDRKPETGAALLAAVAPPEAAEDQLALVLADAGSTVEHIDRAVILDDELDGRASRGVIDGVFG